MKTISRKTIATNESAAGLLGFGLGGNADESEARLCWAVDRLQRLFGALRVAPLYRTAPISPIPQPDFLNSVALAALPVSGRPDPLAILDRVKALERLAGRRATERWGPRPLDIDLLFCGDLVRRGAAAPCRREVILPHPRMRLRRFVLAPLNDLAPDLELPPDGALVRDLLTALGSAQPVEKIGWSLR